MNNEQKNVYNNHAGRKAFPFIINTITRESFLKLVPLFCGSLLTYSLGAFIM